MTAAMGIRARFAAQFVKRGLAIVDFGLTELGVEGSLRPSLYIRAALPAPVADAPEGEAAPLPEPVRPLGEWLPQIDLAVLLDPDEDAAPILEQTAQAGVPLLICRDLTAGTGEHAPPAVDFEAQAAEYGLGVAWRFVSRDEAFYLLVREGYDTTLVSPVRYSGPADVVTVAKPGRPALIVAGFFGRGNCGDEALFQVIYEEFSRDFDVIVSLDEHGAAPEYWNWYPYERCRRIHQGNLADPARTASAMIVGGGGLPIGFVADQVIAARSAGIPIVFAGTDFPASRFSRGPASEIALHEYLNCFDIVALRSAAGVAQARELGRRVVYGADWALNLITDEAPEVVHDENRALITLREFPLQVVSYGYVREITRLIEELRRGGYVPTLLPFCAEDDRFAAHLGIDRLAPSERHWWNARRVKEWIARSGLCISVGRLHPIIFAASTRTPVLQLAPPLAESQDPTSFAKVANMSREFDLDYLPDVDSVVARIGERAFRASGEEALRSGEARLAEMIATLRRVFALR